MARSVVGDLCPLCKNGAVLSRVFVDTDEMECTIKLYGGEMYTRHRSSDLYEALAQLPLPLEEPKPQKKVIDEYPHRCPYCGAKAYLGITPGTTVHHKHPTEAWSCDNARTLRQGPAR